MNAAVFRSIVLSAAFVAAASTADAAELIGIPSPVETQLGSTSIDADAGSIKAAGFTTPAAVRYQLESVTIHREQRSPDITPVMRLHADGGGMPAETLATFAAPPIGPWGDCTFTLDIPYVMDSATTYWFSLYASEGELRWHLRNDWATPSSTLGFTSVGYRWAGSGAPTPPTGASGTPSIYRIYGSEVADVPEPATVALLAAGSLVALARRRAARR